MTVQELKAKLEQMDDNLIVTVCDIEDDSDESFNFKEVESVENVKIKNNKWVSLFFS